MADKKSRSAELLADFAAYCEAHPSERFWQALRNWSSADKIVWQRVDCQPDGIFPRWNSKDTFHWEGRDG